MKRQRRHIDPAGDPVGGSMGDPVRAFEEAYYGGDLLAEAAAHGDGAPAKATGAPAESALMLGPGLIADDLLSQSERVAAAIASALLPQLRTELCREVLRDVMTGLRRELLPGLRRIMREEMLPPYASVQVLAARYGVGRRTMQNWLQELGLPERNGWGDEWQEGDGARCYDRDEVARRMVLKGKALSGVLRRRGRPLTSAETEALIRLVETMSAEVRRLRKRVGEEPPLETPPARQKRQNALLAKAHASQSKAPRGKK